jgi:hypothetical protein
VSEGKDTWTDVYSNENKGGSGSEDTEEEEKTPAIKKIRRGRRRKELW